MEIRENVSVDDWEFELEAPQVDWLLATSSINERNVGTINFVETKSWKNEPMDEQIEPDLRIEIQQLPPENCRNCQEHHWGRDCPGKNRKATKEFYKQNPELKRLYNRNKRYRKKNNLQNVKEALSLNLNYDAYFVFSYEIN